MLELQHEGTGLTREVAYSPDGQWLAMGNVDGTVRVWRIADGSLVCAPAGHSDLITRVLFAPAGDALVSAAGDGSIRLWSLPGGALVQTLLAHRDAVTDLAWAPDGARLASVGDDGTWWIWAFPGRTPILGGPADPGARGPAAAHLAFSPDGTILAVGTLNGRLQLWNALTGRQGSGRSTPHVITSLTFGNGLIVLGDVKGGITPYTIQRNGGLRLDAPVPQAHDAPVRCLALSPDGQTLACGCRDSSIGLWRVQPMMHTTWLVEPRVTYDNGPVQRLVFSPDGATLASALAGGDYSVGLWRVADATLLARLVDPAPSQIPGSPPAGPVPGGVGPFFAPAPVAPPGPPSTGWLRRRVPPLLPAALGALLIACGSAGPTGTPALPAAATALPAVPPAVTTGTARALATAPLTTLPATANAPPAGRLALLPHASHDTPATALAVTLPLHATLVLSAPEDVFYLRFSAGATYIDAEINNDNPDITISLQPADAAGQRQGEPLEAGHEDLTAPLFLSAGDVQYVAISGTGDLRLTMAPVLIDLRAPAR